MPLVSLGTMFRLALVLPTAIVRVVVLATGLVAVALASVSFRMIGWMKRAVRVRSRREAEVPRMRSLRQLVMWEERLLWELCMYTTDLTLAASLFTSIFIICPFPI